MRKFTSTYIISIFVLVMVTALPDRQPQRIADQISLHISTGCIGEVVPVKKFVDETDGYFYEGGLAELMKDAVEAQSMLDEFICALRSFVYNTIFDYEGFLKFLPALETHLDKVCGLVGPGTTWKTNFEGHIAFARYLLRKYKESAIIMDYSAFKTSQAQKLIHKVTQLNVKLLSLLDSHGYPDQQLEGFEPTLTRSSILLVSWDELFQALKDESLGNVTAFQEQMSNIKQTLIYLTEKSKARPSNHSENSVAHETIELSHTQT